MKPSSSSTSSKRKKEKKELRGLRERWGSRKYIEEEKSHVYLRESCYDKLLEVKF